MNEEVWLTLAVVRSLSAPRRLASAQDAEDYEQELVDQYALAGAGAGFGDTTIAAERATIFEFISWIGRPVWTTQAKDLDGFLAEQRRRKRARSTIYLKAGVLARFFDFLVLRYQGDIHALTGYLVDQPVDEFNRPANPEFGEARIPPSAAEVDVLFGSWREALPEARKFLPMARNYMAAALWRRVGLRINETIKLDIRDWRPDLGEHGKLHVRFGKGSRGRGHKTRLVSAIDRVDELMTWWLTDVRHQFGDDWSNPDAPLFPSERHGIEGQCARVQDQALRSGLAAVVALYLPDWVGRLTPHVLRHFCASNLYERGLDLKSIQETLGHEWLSTTTRYIHVHSEHVDRAWRSANERVEARLATVG